MTTHILGLDIGLAHCGCACLSVSETPAGYEYKLVAATVIVTEKRAAKVAVSTTEDNVRRMRQYADELTVFAKRCDAQLVITESQSWPRSSSVVGKIGMAWGVTVAVLNALPRPPAMFDVPPQAIKLAVCGNKSASKDDIIAAITAKLGPMPSTIKKADREHACDAAAAVMAAVHYREDVKLWIKRS